MKERIQKILANAGVASRRNVEEMIRQGRVAVNGKIVIELPVLVEPKKDRIEVDGELIRLSSKEVAQRLYLLMNKPKGVYTTNVSQGEQTRAIDLLPPNLKARVYPVGRLDSEAKGLLLLTNDGELTNRLTHPRYGVPKTYRAVVDGFVPPEMVQELEKGIWMADPKSGKGFKTGRSQIRIVSRSRTRSTLDITIRESRNPQVRRMLARFGHKVRELTRVKMGPLTLQGLAPGDVRSLTTREVRQLQKVGSGEEGKTRPERSRKPE